MTSEMITLTVLYDQAGMRLDQWISEELTDRYSRSQISKWIKSGLIVGPEKGVKSSRKIEEGEIYTIHVPEVILHEIEPVDLSLRILYEDQDIAVIVKPPGIPVHPGKGDPKTTLLNGIYYIWEHLKPTPENFRPGIVHRLDSSTEGVLIVALNSNALWKMSDQFKDRTVQKYYTAWLLAAPPQEKQRIELPIKRHPVDRLKMTVHEDGRSSVTSYELEKVVISKKGRKFSKVNLQIETGRTHQIR
ncbi:MAG: RluA family pseudouridine synthase, partial [Spirochaetia bacterium]|nr:RluA family pseudouridine synthase [Spirochaetia bacterium]